MRLILLVLVAGALRSGESGPTGEEQEILGLLNLHRTDQALVDSWVDDRLHLVPGPDGARLVRHWDAKRLTKREIPPLVLQPGLMAAARSILASGAKPVDRKRPEWRAAVRAAGSPADGAGMAMLASGAETLREAYLAAAQQVVEEVPVKADATRLIFAGREALQPTWREAGVAVARVKGRWSIAIVLGPGTAKRLLGGVAWDDADRDGRYDAGEGRAGVRVCFGAAEMTTGPAGSWWLALDSDAAGTLQFQDASCQASRSVSRGSANCGIDWQVPDPGDCARIDQLLAAADRAGSDPVRLRGALAALLAASRIARLDDGRREAVGRATEPMRDEFAALVGMVKEALAESDSAVFNRRLASLRQSWPETMMPWFTGVEAMYRIRQQANAALAAPPERRRSLLPPARRAVAKGIAEALDPAMVQELLVLDEALGGQVMETRPRK
jgi:hypothetical protein